MPSLVIPESGLSLEGPPGFSSKSGSAVPNVLGLTLTNGMIEDMIKCVQNGKPIQLSLGAHPNLSFGNKIQQLSAFEDPFTHELYRSSYSSDSTSDKMNYSDKPLKVNTNRVVKVENKLNARWQAGFGPSRLAPLSDKKAAASTKSNATSSTSMAGEDTAFKDLKNSMDMEKAKKKENTTKLIDGPLQKPSNKSKFLGQRNPLNDPTRSMSASPARSGAGSPSVGPTSVPLSQQQAELSKTARKPVVHLLALGPMSNKELQKKLPEISNDDLEQALKKVADEEMSTHKYYLKKLYYKELDIWSYEYETDDDRQKAIDNAVKTYDKMRISQSEAEWERLKPISQRGNGVSLSKVQAKIAQGPIPRTPKIHVQKADSGRDTPAGEDEDHFADKKLSRVKGENTSRSAIQPPATKPKKANEKEAQPKRSLSNQGKKPAPKQTSKKENSKAATKPLSKQFVTDSDEEDDDHLKEKPAPKTTAPVKRARDDDSSTSSDSSMPLSKKVKKDTTTHRVSDASQSSRTTNTSTSSSSSTAKTKGTSPQKSSPLASSPPTNASEFGDSSSSSSSTPAHPSTKNSHSPIHKRHQKSSSVTSSASSTSSFGSLNPHILELAAKYRVYYPKYEALYRELSEDLENRDETKEEALLDMHERLFKMKKEIKEATRAAEMGV